MKILKHGNLKPRKFVCWHCDCEFVADVSEYHTTMVNGSAILHSAFCPECSAETTDSYEWKDEAND